MSHHEQQRAVGYPTFPGNIEALSLPAYSPERHASQDSSSSIATSSIVSPPLPSSTLQTSTSDTSNVSNASTQSSRPKRRQTLAACRPCRKRKSRLFHTPHDANKIPQCDGARPRCNTCIDKASPCVYSVEEGKTQQQASREELKAYRTIVCMLRRASPPDTEVILRHLKQHDDVNEAVKVIKADITLRDSVSPSQA
ncbi:hypothetical protein E4T44_05292 [Aureobasidium sp. EXF-8845]|nr:hypothetical protein E4T44_05292 [Aureobasidium sp. EXF-8845]KAI4851082.1 hypothetical protein E4T45_05227 [Aureobasidium sp. EXF-8846]